MKHKELGRTGVTLPELGLGTWQYRGGVDPLRVGIALGACLIDTAESYGTETVVGRAIKGIRERIFIATKVSPRHFERAAMIGAVDESLKRLGTDYIDLCQLHWPNYNVPIEETMGAMEELVSAGKVRFIGVSNFSVAELRAAQKALSSRNRVVCNQVRYNLVDRSVETGLLSYCEANYITIIAYSPLARGLHYIRNQDPAGALQEIAEATRKTPAQVALNWCIGHHAVLAIPKASSSAHIEENCGASGWGLSTEHVRLLDEKIRFQRRGRLELTLRRHARRTLQRFGRNL